MRLLCGHFHKGVVGAVYCLPFDVGMVFGFDVVLNFWEVCEDVVLDVESGFVHFMEVALEFAVWHVLHFHWPFNGAR